MPRASVNSTTPSKARLSTPRKEWPGWPDQPLPPGAQADPAQRPYRLAAQVPARGHRQVQAVPVGLPGLRGRPGGPPPRRRARPVVVAGHRGGADDHRVPGVRAHRAAEGGGRVGADQPPGRRGQHHLTPGDHAARPLAGHGQPGGDHAGPGPHRDQLRPGPHTTQRAHPQGMASSRPVAVDRAADANRGDLAAHGRVRVTLGRRGPAQPALGHPGPGQRLGPPDLAAARWPAAGWPAAGQARAVHGRAADAGPGVMASATSRAMKQPRRSHSIGPRVTAGASAGVSMVFRGCRSADCHGRPAESH